MAGILNALLVDEHVDVLQVPRGAEAVGVRSLAPLMVSLLVTVSAVLGGVKTFGVEELSVRGCRIGGKERRVLAESKVIAGSDGIVEWCGRPGHRDVRCVVGEGLIGSSRIRCWSC